MRKIFPRYKYLIVVGCCIFLLGFTFLRSNFRDISLDYQQVQYLHDALVYGEQQAQPPPQQQQQDEETGARASASKQLACQSPQIPVNASALMANFKPHAPIDCGLEPDWVYVHAGRIHFRWNLASKHAGFQCEMTPVRRRNDFNVRLEAARTLKENGTVMPSEGVFVDCSDAKGEKFKVRSLECLAW